jgi:hypothetical protein
MVAEGKSQRTKIVQIAGPSMWRAWSASPFWRFLAATYWKIYQSREIFTAKQTLFSSRGHCMAGSRSGLWTACVVVLWLATMVAIMVVSFAGYGFSR